MKKLLFILSMLMMTLTGFAKGVQTMVVTTKPQMHCAGCENKIKNGLKYEKGIKDIITSVPDQTVTVKYDPSKTNEENITEAFKKMGYSVRTVKAGEKVTTMPSDGKMNNNCQNKQ